MSQIDPRTDPTRLRLQGTSVVGEDELPPDPEARTWAPSRAVIANSEHHGGVVVWAAEDSWIEEEIHNTSTRLDDLGLDDAPRGISIWEGDFVWRPGGFECPQDGYTDPVGAFRPPTDEEWRAIRAGENPFSSPKEPNS